SRSSASVSSSDTQGPVRSLTLGSIGLNCQMTQTKRCTRCGIVKPRTEFKKRPSVSRDSVRPECRACSRIIQRNWKRENPERRLLIAARSRAKRSAQPFNLTIEDIYIPDECPMLGIALD